jgi:hypothetical protein
MTAKTELPAPPPVSPETRPASRSRTAGKNAEEAGPRAYWGDRLTLKFWLFCFAVMLAMNVLDALQRFIRFLLNGAPAP